MADAPKFRRLRKPPSVGYIRRALASISDVEADEIGHYAVAMVTTDGHLVVQFCCDDREVAAGLFLTAGTKVATERGQSRLDKPAPPMPEESN